MAGSGGLDNAVRHVTVIDAPDAVEWLRGGEIVLTTAYHIKDDPSAQVRLIDALARKKVACLGIKLRRFLDGLSEDALARANEERLPIVQVPFELAWIDIINPILSDVMDRQTRLLEQSWEVHQRFLDTVLNGGDIKSVAATLAELLARPVVIADTNFRVLAEALPERAERPLSSDGGTFTERREGDCSLSLERTERLLLVKSAMESMKQPAADSGLRASTNPSVSHPSPGTPDLRRPLGVSTLDASSPETFRFVSAESGEKIIVAEIRTKHETYGHIFVGAPEPAAGENIDAGVRAQLGRTEIIAIQQAVTVAALEIIKRRATEEVERRYRFNFIDDLLQGNFETREAVIRRAQAFGWDFSHPHVLLVLDIDGFERYYLAHPTESEGHMQRIKDRMLAIVRSLDIEGAGPLIGVDRSDSIVVLSPVGPGTSPDEAKRISVALGRTLSQRACEKLKPLTVSVGIGRFYPDVLLLWRSYLEAREALDLGRRVWGDGSVVHYDHLGVYRLALKCSEPGELGSFVGEHLGKLLEYDRAHNTAFVKTLEVYIRTNSCLAETASRLFVHVNTLKYRLRRIQEILDVDLSDPEVLLNLNVAMKVKDIPNLTSGSTRCHEASESSRASRSRWLNRKSF